MANPDIHIIGAGPVGLAAALLLAAQDRRVTIHEARDAISLTDANNYPKSLTRASYETGTIRPDWYMSLSASLL